RRLVVEAKARAVVTDPYQSAFTIDEARGTRSAHRFLPLRQHRRGEGILREGVEHVGQQKLLMLFLMLQAKFDQLGCRTWCAIEKLHHRSIDMFAVGADALS